MSRPTVSEARSRVFDDWAEALHNGGGDVDRAIDYLPEEHRRRVFLAFNGWQAFATAIHADAFVLAVEVDRLGREFDEERQRLATELVRLGAEHAKAVELADQLRAEREARARVVAELRWKAETSDSPSDHIVAMVYRHSADLVEQGVPVPPKEG